MTWLREIAWSVSALTLTAAAFVLPTNAAAVAETSAITMNTKFLF